MKTGHSAQGIFEYCENVGERSLTVRSMVRSRIPDVGAASEDEFMDELRLLGAELVQTSCLEHLRCPHVNIIKFIVYLSIDSG